MRFLRAYLLAVGAVLGLFWAEFLALGLVRHGRPMAYVSDQPSIADSLRMTVFYLPYILVFTLVLGCVGLGVLRLLRTTRLASYVTVGFFCGALGAVFMGARGTLPPNPGLAALYALLGAAGAATFWRSYRPGA
jgi:hypothetical protein